MRKKIAGEMRAYKINMIRVTRLCVCFEVL